MILRLPWNLPYQVVELMEKFTVELKTFPEVDLRGEQEKAVEEQKGETGYASMSLQIVTNREIPTPTRPR